MKKLLIAAAIFVAGCGGHAGHVEERKNSAPRTRVELASRPSPPVAGSGAELVFNVKTTDGAPVNEFEIVHEKPMHLLIVTEDLSGFWHEHPEARNDGSFILRFAFPAGGRYRLFADYKPNRGDATVDPIDVDVAGAPYERKPLAVDQELTRGVDGITATLKPSAELVAGKDLFLKYDLIDTASEKPVDDLQNYLGAKAHLVIISEDLKQFVHAHPLAQSVPHSVTAHVKFPAGGKYRIWTQFNRQNRIITVPFTVEVK